MTLKDKLQLAWKNRDSIVEGFWNAYIGCSQEIKEESLRRLTICRTNECGKYDPTGQSERVVMKGKESCGQCGCGLFEKTHDPAAHCPLRDIGEIPKWEELITEEQSRQINKIQYDKQIEQLKKQQGL